MHVEKRQLCSTRLRANSHRKIACHHFTLLLCSQDGQRGPVREACAQVLGLGLRAEPIP